MLKPKAHKKLKVPTFDFKNCSYNISVYITVYNCHT